MPPIVRLLLLLLLTLSVGCDDREQQLRTWQQAQVTQIQRHAQENAATTNSLVAAEAESRRQFLSMEQDLQNQRNVLEQDRQAVASARERLPLLAAAEKQTIWKLYRQLFALDTDQPLPSDESWTGAEIRACCRLAALLDLPLVESAKNIVPVAVTAAESVERLRNWAAGRCLDATHSGIYQRTTPKVGKTARRVTRDPSRN